MPSPVPKFTPALDRDVVDEVATEWWVKSARRIRRRRLALGMTQAHLARQCGITSTAIGYIERGVTRPAEPTRWVIADTLCVEAADIWEPITRDELHRRCANLVEQVA